MAMAAGIATLDIIRDTDACERATAMATKLRAGMNEVLEDENVAWAVYGEHSFFHLHSNPRGESIRPAAFDAHTLSIDALKGKADFQKEGSITLPAITPTPPPAMPSAASEPVPATPPAPIFVSEKVMDEAAFLPENEEQAMHAIYNYAFITDSEEGLILVDVIPMVGVIYARVFKIKVWVDSSIHEYRRHRLWPPQPSGYNAMMGLPGNLSTKPKFIVHGEEDELIALKTVRQFYAGLPEPREFVQIDRANHLFDGQASEVGDALEELLADFS